MANSKISDLTTGSAPVATDELVVARSGANYKLTHAQVFALPTGSVLTWNADTGLARQQAGIVRVTNGSSGNGSLFADRVYALSSGTTYGIVIDAPGTILRSGSTGQFAWSSTTDAAVAADTGLARNAAGIVGVTNGSSGLGYLKHGTPVTANTGTASPAVTDSGILYSNTGDADGSIITLPNDPTIGTTIEAFANVNQAITINVSAGESIQDGAVNGTSTVSSTQGAWMRLVAVTGGSGAIWGVCGKLGTWVTT